MPDAFIRRVKGVYMFFMFVLWGTAIALFVVAGAPVHALALRVLGPRPRAYQGMFRFYNRVFLWLLDKGGLLRELPPAGTPHEGPCVVVANHPGLFDVLVLVRRVPDMSVMVANKLQNKIPIAPFIRHCGYVFSPGPGRGPLQVFSESVAALRRGMRFQLFPEGTRSPAGGLLPFSPGFARIARQAGVPVQPVLIENAPPFLPHEEAWHFPLRTRRTVRLVFWEPLPPPEPGQERAMARELSARFREALGLPEAEDAHDTEPPADQRTG